MTEWLAETTEEGEVIARVGRESSKLVAEWPHIGRLTAERDGSEARFEAASNADPVQRTKIERGVVRLLLRSLEGKIGLHASAVGRDGRAIVLLGRPRDGKSTLAAALCARGMELLADDAAALDASPWAVVPTEESHFLDEAARRVLSLDASNETLRWKSAIAAPREKPTTSTMTGAPRVSGDRSARSSTPSM